MEATAPKSNTRRDFLVDIEAKMQAKWDENNVYESNAPEDYSTMSFEEKNKTKFFNTFPYPYMNGKLHLGHAYSMSKNEFASRYQRMQGKNVLFPFGFHCTGMPIAAAAKRLVLEKEFAKEEGKQGGEKKVTQKDILISMGIPEEEIVKFEDPEHWLDYFYPFGMDHLKQFGLCTDWRRSFITTSKNPYYDSFIRWQFSTLKANDKITFGRRPAVYSILDGQPCADHDRSKGEGVGPQEYTLIKLRMLEFPVEMKDVSDKDVFMVAATLRPETMYGQTNCFVLPEGKYGVYEMPNNEYFVSSERAIKNMAYQDLTPEFGKWNQVASVKGSSLVGIPLSAPLTKYEKVYTLPLLTISMNKGTGIVTSVPSDAPNDYAALMDFKTKEDMRTKYNVNEEWVADFEPIPIIDIPADEESKTDTIDMIAVELCKKMKIKSQKDIKKLDEAKDIAYKKGFNNGIFSIGEFKGKKVSEVKDEIKAQMIEAGQALNYYEPENMVVSRSRDECIVALVDQWLIKYGEEDWKNFVEEHVKSDNFEAYAKTTQKGFEEVIDWLKEWGCSRNFGLGTKVPWDEQFVIESLSDSTIYMAYYTVAHLLQGGVVDGSKTGPLGIAASDLTHGVWDYVFLGKEYPADCTIPQESLDKLRHEFNYWYPMDLRCSGKDLIRNHLTMCLYNHAAIWKDKEMMPRSMFCNGYMLLNDKPMAKSEGNFLTIQDACNKYSTSATRLALADSGDTLDDGNFRDAVANSSILRQFVFGKWIKENVGKINHEELDWEKAEESYDEYDRIFDNELNRLIKSTTQMYSEMKYKLALKYGFHDLQNTRDDYALMKKNELNPYLVMKYTEVQLKLLTPIIPHFAEYHYEQIFRPAVLKTKNHGEYPELIINARWPEPTSEYNSERSKIFNFIKYCKHHFIVMHDKMTGFRKEQKNKQKGKKKQKSNKNTAENKEAQAKAASEATETTVETTATEPEEVEKKSFDNCLIFYAEQYPEEQQVAIKALLEIGYDDDFTPKDKPIAMLKSKFSNKKELGKAMKFAAFLSEEVSETRSLDPLDLETPYNEREIINEHKEFIFGDLKFTNVEFKEKNED